MKRLGLLILLFIFIFYSTGLLLIFKVQQYRVRTEIKAQIKRGLSNDQLHVITAYPGNAAMFLWEDKNEFRYQGVMYDVVRKRRVEQATIYYCINDEQETGLLASIEQQFDKNDDTRKSSTVPMKNLLRILFSLFYEPAPSLWIRTPDILLSFQEYTHQYPCRVKEVLSPPPWA
ncbi:MAG: hypothetical protein IPP77_01330 [Bacteroidetes bacterium]|nr:hypothetical protein [Bacteroidota bacterium]